MPSRIAVSTSCNGRRERTCMCTSPAATSGIPERFEKFARVAEFLDGRPEVRAAGRERFKVYRGKSLEPQTHNV